MPDPDAHARLARSPGPFLVGLDLGTSTCKGVLATAAGRALHVAVRPTPTTIRGDAATHDPALLLATADALVAELSAEADRRGGGASRIAGIGIASMAEAGIPVDSSGRPIGEIVAWFDSRPARDAEAIADAVGREHLFSITGLRPTAKCTLARLRWLGRTSPASIARMRGWLGIADLVAHHLTGERGTDASLASRTLAYDVGARRWSAELLALVGLGPEHMPPVLGAGSPVGVLRRDLAAGLGMAAGTPVCVAGHDHLVGALAAGVTEPGDALDSMGSAEPVLLVTERPVLDDAIRAAGMSVGCHAMPDRWYALAGLQASGALVDWFVERFMSMAGVSDGERQVRAPEHRYESFVRLLERAREGPSDVTVLPYLRGRSSPHPDPTAGLTVAGLTPAHGLSDVAAGILDGTAFAVRWMAEALERTTGAAIGQIGVIGGATRNARWMSAKAAASPWPLRVLETEEAVALGAASLGGVSAGLFASAATAVAAMRPSSHSIVADATQRDAYERAYRERFLPLARSTIREVSPAGG